jgi:hypothetical protein
MVEHTTKQSDDAPPPGPQETTRARQRRLLELRETPSVPAPRAKEAAVPAVPAGGQGRELNDFIKQLVNRREQRRHQLEIIQDFFENPVEFGIQADEIPSGTPLEEIRERKKELRYRIDLLRSVLEALEGEHKLLTHAEISALRPHSDPVE